MHVLYLGDGHRRWSREHNVPNRSGYDAGCVRLGWAVGEFRRNGVTELSVALASADNMRRDPAEVESFMAAFLALSEHITVPVDVTLSGNLDLLPQGFRPRYEALARRMSTNGGMPLRLLLAWSVQDEVVRLARRAQDASRQLECSPDALRTMSDIPSEVDLIIRNGNVNRLSAFFPIFSPYAEICFLKCMAPDLSAAEIRRSLRQVTVSERRYGR